MKDEQRIVELIRKSDGKKLPAEVRTIPNRFAAEMAGETITVAFMNFGEQNSYTALKYEDDWNWSNDEYECHFLVPEPVVEVEPQTARSVSPILEKGTKMTITSSK